jgi:hypothetical protein
VLDRRAGLTTAELARNSFVTPRAMGDLVTALERRGSSSATGTPPTAAGC